MTARPSAINVSDYRNEVLHHSQHRPDDYHPATAREPRRILTWNGESLTGSNNGEGRNDWRRQANVTVHAAMTGTGYAYGIAVAACNSALEIGQNAELADLVKLSAVDQRLLCRRPGCRAIWQTGGEQ